MFPSDSLSRGCPKIPLRTKSRFVPAPSEARLRFYTPGLPWRLEKLFPLREKAREDGNAEARSRRRLPEPSSS